MNIFHTYSLKSLKKNKTRTLVTIIGIILSVAMITAVTTMIATIQNFGISYITSTTGDWHVYVNDVNGEKRENFYADDRVKTTYDLRNVGYAYLDGSVNEYKPYLCIQAMNKDFKENMPIHLTEGRMPENDREILIPDHVYINGGVEYKIGDTIDLDIGYRIIGNEILWQKSELDAVTGDDGNVKVNEQLITEYERAYTVVGFYERPDFEPYSAPGYTALTMQGEDFGCTSYDCYMVMKEPNTAFDLWDEIALEGTSYTDCNNSLLRFYGLSTRNDYNAVLYGMGSILIGIIMLGSVALIYNAFAISISERTKQFGLLSSIGATKKQMKKSICFEGLVLCVAGIPLGVISGIAGIGVTLYCLREPLQNIMDVYDGVSLKLHVSLGSVVVAVIVGIVTVLISAYLPMRRALKISAIDAIKQRGDIKLNQKSVRIPGLVGGLFGVEGTIAYKNYKRNKKQYRATVISLAMSIILFVTTGCFTTYLFGSFGKSTEISPYDINVMAYGVKDAPEVEDIYEEMCGVEGVTPYYRYAYTESDIVVAEVDLTDEALQALGNNQIITLSMQFLPDDVYQKMVKHYGLDEEKYADIKNAPPILMNSGYIWDDDLEDMYAFSLLREDCSQFYSIKSGNAEESDAVYYSGCEVREKDGRQVIVAYEDIEEDMTEKEVPVKDCVLSTFTIGDIVNASYEEDFYFDDFGLGLSLGPMGVGMVYPMSMADTVLTQIDSREYDLRTDMYFKTEDHKKAYDEMSVLLQKYDDAIVYDDAAGEEEERSILIMIQVFSYGFIILISLISAANVFNTISTNMNLRRREFAMLKSFGMSEKGFRKMMNFECVLYGVKGLFYGLVLAILLVVWMYYKSMGDTLEGFYLPWQYVGIVVVCVFAVVYSTMVYGRIKLKKENIVDALKNENQ